MLALIFGVIGAILGASTALVQGISQTQQAKNNAEMAARNAAQEQSAAQNARNQAKVAADAAHAETDAAAADQRKKNAFLLAENRAAAGSMGMDGTGSALLVAVDNAEEAELAAREVTRKGRNEEAQLVYQGEVNAVAHENKAKLYQYESDTYNVQATNSIINTVFSTGIGTVAGAFMGAQLGAGLGELMSGSTLLSKIGDVGSLGIKSSNGGALWSNSSLQMGMINGSMA